MSADDRPARMRASDQDRHEAVLALGDHHAAGRLDLAEFTTRMEQAHEAVYLDELDPLFVDLPARVTARTPAAAPATRGRPRFAPHPAMLLLPLLAVALVVTMASHGFPLWLFVIGFFMLMRLGHLRRIGAGHRHPHHHHGALGSGRS